MWERGVSPAFFLNEKSNLVRHSIYLLGSFFKGEVGSRNTYKAPSDHLPREELDVPLVLVAAANLTLGEDIAQVVFQVAGMPAEGQPRVLVFLNQFVHVQPVAPELVQERTPEVGGVGDVGDFVELFWKVDGDELPEAGELEVREFRGRHGSEFLAVGPDISVRDGEEICLYRENVGCRLFRRVADRCIPIRRK